VHLLYTGDSSYGSDARLTNAQVEKLLGVATNRNLTVIRALVEKWC
jgi:RecA/RadA recombinase